MIPISVYLQVQAYIITYALLIGWLGYISYVVIEGTYNIFCRRRQLQPPRQYQPESFWYQIGWYRLRPTESVPLFHNRAINSWAYLHQGKAVRPTEAAVTRRGIIPTPTT